MTKKGGNEKTWLIGLLSFSPEDNIFIGDKCLTLILLGLKGRELRVTVEQLD